MAIEMIVASARLFVVNLMVLVNVYNIKKRMLVCDALWASVGYVVGIMASGRVCMSMSNLFVAWRLDISYHRRAAIVLGCSGILVFYLQAGGDGDISRYRHGERPGRRHGGVMAARA